MSIPVDGSHVDFENIPRDMFYQIDYLVQAHLCEALIQSKDVPGFYCIFIIFWVNLLVINNHELLSKILTRGIGKGVLILLVTSCLTGDTRDYAFDIVIV